MIFFINFFFSAEHCPNGILAVANYPQQRNYPKRRNYPQQRFNSQTVHSNNPLPDSIPIHSSDTGSFNSAILTLNSHTFESDKKSISMIFFSAIHSYTVCVKFLQIFNLDSALSKVVTNVICLHVHVNPICHDVIQRYTTDNT